MQQKASLIPNLSILFFFTFFFFVFRFFRTKGNIGAVIRWLHSLTGMNSEFANTSRAEENTCTQFCVYLIVCACVWECACKCDCICVCLTVRMSESTCVRLRVRMCAYEGVNFKSPYRLQIFILCASSIVNRSATWHGEVSWKAKKMLSKPVKPLW